MLRRSQVRFRWNRINAPLAASALATCLCVAVLTAHLQSCIEVPGLDSAERSTEDIRAIMAGSRSPKGDQIVIVALDDRTRARDPDLVQNRRGFARLFRAVAEHQPAAVGIDVFFAHPEINLDPEVVSGVRAALAELDDALATVAPDSAAGLALAGARAALDAVLEETRGDEVLAQTVARAGDIYLPVLFHLDDRGSEVAAEPPGLLRARVGEVVVSETTISRHPPRADSVTTSLDLIATAARGAGSVNVTRDPDGALRRVPLVIEHAGRYYQSLAVALVAAALEPGTPAAVGYITGSRQLRIGSLTIPTDRRGRITLSYLGPSGTFPHYSAADVAAELIPPGTLAGKIVLVGYTEAARDKIIQPHDRAFAGVEAHATAIHNLLHGELNRHVGPTWGLLIVAAIGVILTLLQLRRIRQRRWIVSVGALCLLVGYWIAAQWLYDDAHWIVPVVAPTASIMIITATALFVGLATEGREKALLRQVFSHYVQQSVVDRILADPDRLRLGGERRELTVLFSDIRGFSSIAEELEPEVVSEYLNQYLTPMTEIVQSEGGMLDKYIGDALMAVYGAPFEVGDHAMRACRSALAMQAALVDLNRLFAERGLPAIDIGIGINTGPMSVGNMGSQARFDYTVVGDAVNVGSRLEGLTRVYRVGVLIGEATAKAIGQALVVRELDYARVLGRAEAQPIYQLVGSRDQTAIRGEDLELFAAALAHYRIRNWDEAERDFTIFADRHPDDGPTRTFLGRIAELRTTPPPDDWDGVFEQQAK